MRLKDRVAIITGGGTGIGKAIALAFAREGAHAVLAARRPWFLEKAAQEVQALGRKVLVVQVDVSKEDQVRDMVARAIDAFGRVDIMVNNAGGPGVVKSLVDMTLEEWNAVIEQNLLSTMLCTREVLKFMIPQRSGTIINFSSTAGKGGFALRSHYAAAKAAIINFTQSIAWEVGKHNIRVNCISPGAVATPALKEGFQARADALGVPVEEITRGHLAKTALVRFATPEEAAALAVFIASDESSGETGQTFNITAGTEMR